MCSDFEPEMMGLNPLMLGCLFFEQNDRIKSSPQATRGPVGQFGDETPPDPIHTAQFCLLSQIDIIKRHAYNRIRTDVRLCDGIEEGVKNYE